MVAPLPAAAGTDSADQLCDQACKLEREGRTEAALACYRQAIATDPRHYRSLLLVTNLLTISGRRREATQWARGAFASDGNAFARNLLIEALVMEAMDTASQKGPALVDHTRLLWIGSQLCLMKEKERAQAVLAFVQEQGNEDQSQLAVILLKHLTSDTGPHTPGMGNTVSARSPSRVPDITVTRISQAVRTARAIAGNLGELTMLRVPLKDNQRGDVILSADDLILVKADTAGKAMQAAFACPMARALALAAEGDTLGAAMEIYEYLKIPSPPEFGVYAPPEDSASLGFRLRFPLVDFSQESARRFSSKQEAIQTLARHYHGGVQTSRTQWMVEALALGACRWHGLEGRYQVCIDVIEEALKVVPFAMHLKTARAAAGAKAQGEKLHPRLEKFVGEDSGYLKKFVCPEPFTRIDIDQKGGARVCCGHWMPTQIGSVMQHDPLVLLNSPIARKIKQSVMEGDYRYCNHLDCMAMVQERLPTKADLGEEKLALWARDDYTTTGVDHVLFAFDQSCNLSCPSCRTEKIVEKNSLSQRKMEVVEHKIAPMLKGLKKLYINPAGELFTSKLARRMLSLVNPKENPDLEIDIISNGTLFNEENWNSLSNIHELVGVVRVSVDGATKATFETLRRLAVWEPFIENMKFLRDLRLAGRIKSLRYSFTYQRDNFREMEDFVLFAREMGCDDVIFEKLQNMGAYTVDEFHARAVHLPDHALRPEYLNMIRREIFFDPGILRDFERPEPAGLLRVVRQVPQGYSVLG
ncbi:MAG: hypothetical protein ACKVQA_00950 [Burkholderiales bacterium]